MHFGGRGIRGRFLTGRRRGRKEGREGGNLIGREVKLEGVMEAIKRQSMEI
jgi:hypothetical protein